MESDEIYTSADSSAPMPLTKRERNRRIALLIALTLLLVILALVSFFWWRNRSLPVPRLAPAAGAIAPPQFLYSITGHGANELKSPIGVDVAPNGNVYVVDFGHARVSVFTSRGRYLFSFNKAGKDVLRNPVHLKIENDTVWVSDRRLRKLLAFDLNGKYKKAFTDPKEPSFKWTPLAFDFDAKGELRATDVGHTDKHRLIYFSADSSRTAMVGKTGQVTNAQQAPASFFFPNGVAIAKNGQVYVSDGDNRRLQVFDPKGKFLKIINTSGLPRGIAIDSKDHLYVVDALAHQIDMYNLDGQQLTSFGERGFGPGQFYFPNDVALDSSGRIYISDRDNNQVQVWGWPALVISRAVLPHKAWQWGLCLIPFLLLPLLLLLRKRRYIITAEFVQTLAAMNRTDALVGRKRIRFVAPLSDEAVILEILAQRADTRDSVQFEEYSPTDAEALREKLRCTKEQAMYLSMAERAYALLSNDVELRRFGILIRARVIDTSQFLEGIDDNKPVG